MKTKRTSTIATTIVALAILTTFGILRNTKPVQAQDVAPPQPERVSFGMIGIAAGQTARINVVNTSFVVCPCDRVVLTFRNPQGQLLRNGRSEVIRQSVELQPGESTFLDLNYDEYPPGPSRLQLRAVITIIPPLVRDPNDGIVSTVEVINNANGRTQFAVFTNPAVIRGFNPQPDPPLE
jgi:hypothetical protein